MISNELDAAKDLPIIPRIGTQIQIDDQYDHLEWYGLGPHETYWDRKRSGEIGLFSASIKNDFFHYVRPQESNNHWDTRWAVFRNEKGVGIAIRGKSPLSFSAWPFAMEDLETAKHINELPEQDFITLNVDHLQMGVGGDNSWSVRALPHPEFRIPAGHYVYEFRISPVRNGEFEDPMDYQLPNY